MSERLCPKCLGLGGWPCDAAMPHYVTPTDRPSAKEQP